MINDVYEGEDFKLLDADRGCVVTTPDGTSLVVREVGPVTAPLTIVFAHGFCVRMGSFHFQRTALAARWGDQVRMVFYDQRGHGQSASAATETYTVPQLGLDLETVLAVMVPVGPIVLVGHSMGGMTVLSHARQFPQRYPRRIVGAALISSAAEGLSRSPLGETLQNPALEAVRFAARYAPRAVHRTRGAIRSLIRPIIRDASFGGADVSPSLVEFSQAMIHGTDVATLVEFLHALEVHDETAALPVLARIPTLIACGGRDLLTPAKYSEEMAAVLPDSELVIVPGAGHLVQLEVPDVINDALLRLVERSRD
jgi:pimeloyl-ACP methyl ester carboxylesterase